MRTGLAPGFLGVFLGIVVAAAAPATARGTPLDACTVGQRACATACDHSFPPSRDDMGHTGCLARCSWDATACAAREALDDTSATLDRDVKPWLADQASRWQHFLEGFRGRGGASPGDGPPRSTPPDAKPDRNPDRNPDRGTSL